MLMWLLFHIMLCLHDCTLLIKLYYQNDSNLLHFGYARQQTAYERPHNYYWFPKNDLLLWKTRSLQIQLRQGCKPISNEELEHVTTAVDVAVLRQSRQLNMPYSTSQNVEVFPVQDDPSITTSSRQCRNSLALYSSVLSLDKSGQCMALEHSMKWLRPIYISMALSIHITVGFDYWKPYEQIPLHPLKVNVVWLYCLLHNWFRLFQRIQINKISDLFCHCKEILTSAV